MTDLADIDWLDPDGIDADVHEDWEDWVDYMEEREREKRDRLMERISMEEAA